MKRHYSMGILLSVLSLSLIIVFGSIVSLFETFFHAKAASNPRINSITLSTESLGSEVSPINLVEGTTTNVYVHGEFEDADGCSDVTLGGNINVTLYRSGVDGASSCVASNANCYRAQFSQGSCVVFGCNIGNETTSTYECTIPLQYYAEPTDSSSSYSSQNWMALSSVVDTNFATSTLSTTTEVNSLVAIGIDGDIAYGILSLGATSTSDTILNITNTGNTSVDSYVFGTDMICGNGAIVASRQHFSLTSGTAYSSMSVLPNNPVSRVQLNLSRQTSDVQSNTSLYFKLSMPTSSVGGNCTGINSIIAIEDQ